MHDSAVTETAVTRMLATVDREAKWGSGMSKIRVPLQNRSTFDAAMQVLATYAITAAPDVDEASGAIIPPFANFEFLSGLDCRLSIPSGKRTASRVSTRAW